MSDPAERRIGSVIAGKWRVDSVLGAGSMAAVYAVTHRNGARAALKILHPTLSADEGVCERFLGEGYLTNSVKHPGIVRVLDDGVTEDGCVFLVMDLLEGKTLEAFRQDQPTGQIEITLALDLADKLMDVLSAVHEAGIIHRDLKPQNVFVCDDGAVKLLDFGVARVLDGGARSPMSMFGLVLGTPSFMSPEQALGARDQVDHRSDIWSLGATLFTAITGQTVHLGPHVQAKLLAAATVKARSITMVKQDLPPPVAAAVDTALRFKAADRWQSVDAFRRALRDARRIAGLGEPSGAAPVAPAPEWLDASLVLAAPSPPPAGARGATLAGLGGVGGGPRAPAPSTPGAFVRQGAAGVPPSPDSEREGSYLAATSTLPRDPQAALLAQVGERRSGAGVWIAGAALLLAASSGVALFAVDRARRADARGSVTSTSLTSATTRTPAPPPTRSQPLRDAAVVPASPIKAAVTPSALRTTRAAPPARPRAASTAPRDEPEPEPEPEEAPAPEAPAADPFGTPQ